VIEISTELSHPKVTVSRIGSAAVKPRFIGVIQGLAGITSYCCFSNTVENAYTAIMERVFYHKVGEGFARPLIPEFDTIVRAFNVFLLDFMQGVTTTVPVALQVYPEMNYRGRKLRLYQKARDNVLGRTHGADFGHLKAFIKHEKIMMKDKRLVPRVIQPRSPEYNVCVGRYIRQLEHRIYDNIDSMWSGPTVMKGRNCVQQGHSFAMAWQSFSNPKAIMLDAVRFDQHVSAPMLQWEHEIYLKYFPPAFRGELAALLRMQLRNHGAIRCADGRVKYEVEGCRASGDMNTAMGNVLIMCAAIYSYAREHEITMRLMNNGDDCCLIVEREVVDHISATLPGWFNDLGFIIDIEGVVDALPKISFCQTHPVFDGSGWVMVRDPATAASKDVTILKKWQDKEYRCYLNQLGVCGLSAYGNLPFWKSFYGCLRRSDASDASAGLIAHVTQPILDSGLGRLATNTHREGPITDTARASFAEAFGMNPAVQRYWEKYFDTMKPGEGGLFPPSAAALHF